MAENLDPPQIAGRHFFVDIKTMHFGRNGTSNSTTEAAAIWYIKPPSKYTREGSCHIFIFPARRARAENKANQQCHFKSSRCPMDPLGTDSCRGTVPMEPPMSNSSMRHQNPDLDFDDTGHFLQGALCIIAARRTDRVRDFLVSAST
jgi:hypothetical protein